MKDYIKKQEELIEHYHNYYIAVNSIHCNKGILAIKRETKKIKSDLSVLKSKMEEVTDKKTLKQIDYVNFLEYIEDKLGESSSKDDRIKIVKQYMSNLIKPTEKVSSFHGARIRGKSKRTNQ